jgi:membrane fusion protein (multidrug efflux system)
VETLVLAPTLFEDVVQVTGAVEAIDDAVLSAQSAGTVTSLAPLGRVVSAGQAVAQLDPFITRSTVDQAKAGVEAAEAQFELAEDNMTRNTPLYTDSVISAIEYENVRAQFNRAKADLARARAVMAQAEEQLRQTRVTAPFSGTVEEHYAELGEQVLPGRQIARIINTSRVKVTAGVPERYAADIRVGTPAQVDFSAYSGAPVSSRVSFVGNAINRDNRTFPVEILLENSGGVLKPEMVAQVFVTREKIEDALVVPRSAIIRDEDGNSVFIVRNEGDRALAEKRNVVLGPAHGGQVVITNLQAGDEVVVLGQSNLTEGDFMQIMEQYSGADDPGISDSTSAVAQPGN